MLLLDKVRRLTLIKARDNRIKARGIFMVEEEVILPEEEGSTIIEREAEEVVPIIIITVSRNVKFVSGLVIYRFDSTFQGSSSSNKVDSPHQFSAIMATMETLIDPKRYLHSGPFHLCTAYGENLDVKTGNAGTYNVCKSLQ